MDMLTHWHYEQRNSCTTHCTLAVRRLDKRKFFVVGLGLFSSVTTCLYPLTVVKTRQMASSHTSPGIAGAWQTARTVAATDGIPGFYRGFTTAVLATIPVRMVYMSALEMTKTATAKLGAKLELAPTTQATVANFCGGGAASLASQCLIVPVDVITQRMMVEGMDAGASSRATTIHSRQGSSSRASSSSSSSNGSSRSSNTTVTAQMERNMQQPSTASQASTSRHANGAPSGVGRATAGIEAASATAQQQRSFSSLASSSSSSSSPWRNSSTTPTLPAGKASQAQPSAGVVHSSATAGIPLEQRLYSNRTTSSSSSSSGAGAGTAHMQRMSAIQMARLIVKEEGLMGLYRGFVPSISTYVPSSAVWWGLYALYQVCLHAKFDSPL